MSSSPDSTVSRVFIIANLLKDDADRRESRRRRLL